MEECTHPHMDPAPEQHVVCYFPWGGSVSGLAEDNGGFFNEGNYGWLPRHSAESRAQYMHMVSAFFIPRLQYVDATEWWRQHSDRLDFVIHTNTGCQVQPILNELN